MSVKSAFANYSDVDNRSGSLGAELYINTSTNIAQADPFKARYIVSAKASINFTLAAIGTAPLTTVSNGYTCLIYSDVSSTGTVTIKNNAGTTLIAISAGEACLLTADTSVTLNWAFLVSANAMVSSPISVGNLVYVDSVFGNNGTGQRQEFNMPFQTINAAFAASHATDTIWVRPGSYTLSPTVTMSGIGQSFFFEAGATVTATVTTSGNTFFGGTVLIYGYGDFITNSTGGGVPLLFNCGGTSNALIYNSGTDTVAVGTTCMLSSATTYVQVNTLNQEVSVNNTLAIMRIGMFTNTINITTLGVCTMDIDTFSGGSIVDTSSNATFVTLTANQFNNSTYAASGASTVVVNLGNVTSSTANTVLHYTGSSTFTANVDHVILTGTGNFYTLGNNGIITLNTPFVSVSGASLASITTTGIVNHNFGTLIQTGNFSMFNITGPATVVNIFGNNITSTSTSPVFNVADGTFTGEVDVITNTGSIATVAAGALINLTAGSATSSAASVATISSTSNNIFAGRFVATGAFDTFSVPAIAIVIFFNATIISVSPNVSVRSTNASTTIEYQTVNCKVAPVNAGTNIPTSARYPVVNAAFT